eukprot:NODE_4_length_55019_cov_0.425091.p4 type:complete len:686 gc:universal NODE_4_length_55019_cov_0.425091:14519-12462(-)
MSDNRVGKIDMKAYEGYDHIGYDLDGEKVLKKNAKLLGRETTPLTGNLIENIMERIEDDYWTSIPNEQQGVMMKLTDEEMEIVTKVRNGEYGDLLFNPDQDYSDCFDKSVESLPMLNLPDPKSSFLPSKWEAKKIRKLVKAIRLGLIKKSNNDLDPLFDLWEKDNDEKPDYIVPPKSKLPTTYESYNPPEEYLPDEDEIQKWKNQDNSVREREFLPQKYSCLRHVPTYESFVKERFYRCLDLYLCPRVKRERVVADPDELLPLLPDPEDLKPFPDTLSVVYRGHQAPVRALAPSPCGQWLLSGSDDGELRLWEVSSGRCLRKWNFSINGQSRSSQVKTNTKDLEIKHKHILDDSFEGIRSIKWNPNESLSVFAVSVGKCVLILPSGAASKEIMQNSFDFVKGGENVENNSILKDNELSKSRNVRWLKKAEIDELIDKDEDLNVMFNKFERKNRNEREDWPYILLEYPFPVNHISWHKKGDYFLTCSPSSAAGHSSVLIHKVSDKSSQNPFSKIKGAVRSAEFHPNSPKIYLATERHLYLFDLSTQTMQKKYFSGCTDVSSMSVHPNGDHVLLGAYDPKITWIDATLSDKPYKSLKFGKYSIQSVDYHKQYPLFAACGDDGHVYIMHGRVFGDLMTHPLIAPIHVLRDAHSPLKDLALGCLNLKFHPNQPWIFSCGSDGTIKLFVN